MQANYAHFHWEDVAIARPFRLDHLNGEERNALEEDLQLTAQVQRRLLPRQDFDCRGWRISYHYEPAGVVSGDYCDVVDAGRAGLYFMVGDVSGKGVAASLVMAHLHAMFRTLISAEFSVKLMLERASRLLCESTLPMHYATLVCGRAQPDGLVEICNAGHPYPLVVRDGEVAALEESGFPVGMFPDEEFPVAEVSLKPGQSIVLYSDGVSEASDNSGMEYGAGRLRRILCDRHTLNPSALVAACRDDVAAFRGGAQKTDDMTILVLGRDRVINTRSLQPVNWNVGEANRWVKAA